jgi:hypothetical protein
MELNCDLRKHYLRFVISFKNLIRKQQGSALVMILMATVGLVTISYLVASRSKIENNIKTKETADRDVEEAMMKIGAYLINPSYCNANFLGKTYTYYPTKTQISLPSRIYTCTGGSCNGTGSVSNVDSIPIIDNVLANIDSWSNTGLTNRIRVIKVEFAMKQDQTQSLGGTVPLRAAILGVYVTFQKNLGYVNGTRNTTIVQKEFEAFVVNGTWNSGTHHLDPSTTILGCAWSSSSTNVYH